MDDTTRKAPRRARVDGRPAYEPPRVLVYSEEELLQQFGPARACASFNPFGGVGGRGGLGDDGGMADMTAGLRGLFGPGGLLGGD
ncbi:MAG: hypothetical protein IT208_04820 [Chthonomonadales bacterium]|nr:hypothetical protein [Chthonomonadales bacterium]